MSKTTRATQALQQAGIAFTVHAYEYDPNAERIGLQEPRKVTFSATLHF